MNGIGFSRVIKVGSSMGLTGPYGAEAEVLVSGVKLAFKQARREGLIKDKLLLVLYDALCWYWIVNVLACCVVV